ncbi:MAG: DUF4230 domain-containing protein [Planctomycetota bacterium]
MNTIEVLAIASLALVLGVVTTGAIVMLLRRKSKSAPMMIEPVAVVAEKVRAVGKLVGLEVHAKEIATSKKGWSWLPPILLTQAKIAMIFHFDKQYYVDLSKLKRSDVIEVSPGHYRVQLPAIEGTLRLTDLTPYDIQAGRLLAMFDVIQMNADTQKQLIASAQEQATALFRDNERRYITEAEQAIEKQLESLLTLFNATVEVVWAEPSTGDEVPELALAS